MTYGKIITQHEYPPIPDRRWDWVAYHDGYEEKGWLHGWGRTEAEALEDLKRIDEERAEDDDDQERYEHETGPQ